MNKSAALDALQELVDVIDAAGLLNLSNGVQLGQTSWYVKASDSLANAKSVLEVAALQQEQGEPVGLFAQTPDGRWIEVHQSFEGKGAVHLYAAPQPISDKPITEAEQEAWRAGIRAGQENAQSNIGAFAERVIAKIERTIAGSPHARPSKNWHGLREAIDIIRTEASMQEADSGQRGVEVTGYGGNVLAVKLSDKPSDCSGDPKVNS